MIVTTQTAVPRRPGRAQSGEARRIAERGTILRCVTGSVACGLNDPQSDRDETGVCCEAPEYVIGNRKIIGDQSGTWETFTQYHYRSAGFGNRSGPGDTDLTIHSLKKFVLLTLAGHPASALLLSTPPEHTLTVTRAGRALLDQAPRLVSRRTVDKFAFVVAGHRDRLTAGHTSRTELVEQFGFDVKLAAHMVRFAVQGAELAETGRITLPTPDPWAAWIRDLRAGQHTQVEALDAAAHLEYQARTAVTPLPERPEHAWVDGWLVAVYRQAWAEQGITWCSTPDDGGDP